MPHLNDRRFDDKTRARIRRNLVRWYAQNARDLPWRRTTDPYRIWISEIMLQQTTVKAVVGYYNRFLREFPDVEALANAPEEQVLRLWEGLGYYTRARNIHRAASVIVRDYAGTFPREVDALRRLPGIGRYTAGAIVSFAFDQAAPIVEANTQRLYSRLLNYAGDIRSSEGQKLLWHFAEELVPRKSPGRFNQALMELGATVCSPVEPACDSCPLRRDCAAFRSGTQHEIPAAARRPEITNVTEVAVVVRFDDRFLLRRRLPGERWAGLWDFPRFPLDEGALPKNLLNRKRRSTESDSQRLPARTRRELQKQVRAQTGLNVMLGQVFAEMNHSVTRYRIRLVCILADCETASIDESTGLCWATPSEFDDFPLSTTGRKITNILMENGLCRAAATTSGH